MSFKSDDAVRDFYEAKGLLVPGERDACGIGFIYSTTGPSSEVVKKALRALGNLSHRGVKFADGKTGDGAGIRLQLPRDFREFVVEKIRDKSVAASADFVASLETAPHVAVGQFFFNQNNLDTHRKTKDIAEARVREYLTREAHSSESFTWRAVPVDLNYLGPRAQLNQPAFEQLILPNGPVTAESEGKLYVLRQLIEHDWKRAGYNVASSKDAYIPSFSADSIVYKGMSVAENVEKLNPDLSHRIFEGSEWAIIHQRMSTNTTSTADKAHPYRFVVQNGEINTLRGDITYFTSRMKKLVSGFAGSAFSAQIDNVIQRGSSDTGTFDNIVELLVRNGLSLPTAISVMIPNAHGHDPAHQATILQAAQDITIPWDGPVAMVAADESSMVVVRDRNGLRPVRILETTSGLIIGGSEMGMVPMPPESIKRIIPLGPGDKLAIDFRTHTLLMPEALEEKVAYELQSVADKVAARQHDLTNKVPRAVMATQTTDSRSKLFAEQARAHYTVEAIERILDPIVSGAKEATYSMGDDTAIGPFATTRALDPFYALMRQEFAQVTNPPIDSINERGGMVRIKDGKQSLEMPMGSLAAPQASPLLWDFELNAIKSNFSDQFAHLGANYNPSHPRALRDALDQLRIKSEKLVRAGKTQIILSHEAVDGSDLPIPMPLAVSAVHSHLVRQELRGDVALHAHTNELIETHKVAMLIASGANFVTPFLVEKTIGSRHADGVYGEISENKPFDNYRKAINDGLLKIIGKMGISVAASYVGGYNFSLMGFDTSDAARFFPWTPSPIGGPNLRAMQRSQIDHAAAAEAVIERGEESGIARLSAGTTLRYLKPVVATDDELFEMHIWKPEVVSKLQAAAVTGDVEKYKDFVRALRFRETHPISLRDVLSIKYLEPHEHIKTEDVGARETILDRMSSGGISLGALAPWVHRDVALAMNNLRRASETHEGPKGNSGEGGEDVVSRRFIDANTPIKQVASGRFGVTAFYLSDAEIIEIKVAQGAKPGEGGQLPGIKVEGLVAQLRHATPGVTLISPPPHHDIYSIEDLTQLVHDLKTVNPGARVRVKLVSQPGIGQIAVGVAKARVDEIHVAGHSGGTGASPLSSVKYAGYAVESGLAETHQALVANDLRDRTRLIADGNVISGSDILKLMMLGADEVGIGTASLVALGCVMTHKCHLNVCPAGVATQNPELEAHYRGKPEFLENYFRAMADDVRQKLGRLGLTKISDVVGRVDLLAETPNHFGLDLKRLLAFDDNARDRIHGSRLASGERHEIPQTLDERMNAAQIVGRLKNGEVVHLKTSINTTNLSVGAGFAGQIAKQFNLAAIDACKKDLIGVDGSLDVEAAVKAAKAFQVTWPKDEALKLIFTGNAGQSFGAFVVPGMALDLTGFANDYVGKGMSGGKIVIRPFPNSRMASEPERNEIAGSTLLYGATGGETYISGRVNERFMIRGSGARAVIEGCGNYGCEYMSGGAAVVLGEIGREFASGMKGGLAFIYDDVNTAASRINMTDVKVFSLTDPQLISKVGSFETPLLSLIQNHQRETSSPLAARILGDWENKRAKFKVVVPNDILDLVEKPGPYRVDTTAFFRGEPAAVKQFKTLAS